MRKPDNSIKMKPRIVRGRVLKGAARATANTAHFASDRVRVIGRQMEARQQESKPEGEAVTSMQVHMGQELGRVPHTAYRLTRAQIRLIRARVQKRQEITRLSGEAPQSKPRAETCARASPGERSELSSAFDDPAKRPLSARKISNGRENRRVARYGTNEPIPADKGRPGTAPELKGSMKSTSPVPNGTPANGSSPSNAQIAPTKLESLKPRIRQPPSHIVYEKPAPKAPKPRELFRQPAKTTRQKIERQIVRTADAVTRAAGRQSTQSAKAGAKATERAAQTAAKNAAKAAKHMASLARKASLRTAAALRRASQAAIRASTLAAKALINTLMAGGWLTVIVILVLLMCVSVLASPFGIFTHTDANEFADSITLEKAINTINAEYVAEIKRLRSNRTDTLVVIEGNLEGGMEPANWVDVLAVFAVHLTMREENAMDVVQLDKAKVDELRRVFWDMNTLTTSSEADDDGGTTFYIMGSALSYQDMFGPYRFTDQQKQLIVELMSDEYYAFWSNFVNISMGYDPDDWGGVVTVDEDYTPGMSGTVMKIPKLYQFDYRKTVCTIDGERKSVSTSGCGATSMSMVIRYLTGDTSQNPYTLFKWAYQNDYYSGDGLSHSAVSAMGKLYGVIGSWVGKDGERIVKALSDGHPVIAHMGKGIFTKQGHYIVLRGVTESGKILVNDPNSKDRSRRAYPLSTILKQGKTSTPFMICSKKSA